MWWIRQSGKNSITPYGLVAGRFAVDAAVLGGLAVAVTELNQQTN